MQKSPKLKGYFLTFSVTVFRPVVKMKYAEIRKIGKTEQALPFAVSLTEGQSKIHLYVLRGGGWGGGQGLRKNRTDGNMGLRERPTEGTSDWWNIGWTEYHAEGTHRSGNIWLRGHGIEGTSGRRNIILRGHTDQGTLG